MAGSINLANVALGFDASQVTKGVDLSASEIRKLGSVVKASESDLDKYANSMRLLDVAQQKGAITSDRLAAAQAHLAKTYGVETYAMIEARQASERLAKAEAEDLARQKQLDSEMQIGIALRKQVATAEEKLAADTKLYDSYLKQGIIDMQTYNRLLDQMKSKYGLVNTEINTRIRLTQSEIDQQNRLAFASQKVDMAQGGASGLGLLGRAGAYGAAALGGGAIIKNSIGSASDIQATTLAFEVMTKSVSKANMIVAEMRKLDQQSPLGFSAIQQAGKGLIQYRIEAEQVVPILRQLGDITMGDNEKFKLMAYALGQVKGAGRLMGQEARQMTDAGFNPLAQMADEMAKKFGGLADDYMPRLKKQMEDGKIPFVEVTRAIEAATKAGGTFHGMTQRINTETTKGAITNMVSEVKKLGASFGETLRPSAGVVANIVQLSAATLAFPFNRWNDMTRSFADLNLLMKSSEAMPAFRPEVADKKTQFEQLTKEQVEIRKRLMFKSERENFDSQVEAINEEYRKKMIGEEKFAEMKLRTALQGNAMIDGDRERLEEALWKRSAIKQMEAFDKAKKDRENQVQKEADAKQKYNESREKIRGNFEEKRAKILSDGKDALGISQTIAPALKAGSVEAYKFMLGQKDKVAEIAERQEKLMNEALAEAKKQTTALENQPLLNKKR